MSAFGTTGCRIEAYDRKRVMRAVATYARWSDSLVRRLVACGSPKKPFDRKM
jgi:hypothetical protein